MDSMESRPPFSDISASKQGEKWKLGLKNYSKLRIVFQFQRFVSNPKYRNEKFSSLVIIELNLLFSRVSKIWDFFFFFSCLDKTESMLQAISQSMATTTCGDTDLETCRDESSAQILKFVAIAAILIAGVSGVAIPLVGRKRRFLRTDGNIFYAAKAFAAGVILATGFVHMLPDGASALSDSCLPKYPWSKFPFSGMFAMVSALTTLVVDFVGTQYYERKQERSKGSAGQVRSSDPDAIVPLIEAKDPNGKVFGEEEGGGMHIVGIHAHAAHHRHNHPRGEESCDGSRGGHDHGHGHVHSHGFGLEDGDEEDGDIRHVVVSQVIFFDPFVFT